MRDLFTIGGMPNSRHPINSGKALKENSLPTLRVPTCLNSTIDFFPDKAPGSPCLVARSLWGICTLMSSPLVGI